MSFKKIAFVLMLSFLFGYSISLWAKVEDKSSETAVENQEESLVVETAGRSKKNIVIEIEIDGTINPATVDYIDDGIDYALKNSAQALLITLDTPGGLLYLAPYPACGFSVLCMALGFGAEQVNIRRLGSGHIDPCGTVFDLAVDEPECAA